MLLSPSERRRFLPLLRLRPRFCRVSFACCYTYAGIPPDEVLADAGGTATEFQLAVLTLHLVVLPLLSQNNNMFPLRAFKRRHSKVLEALGAMCGGWGVVGGWLVQAQGTPQNSKNTFEYYTRMLY